MQHRALWTIGHSNHDAERFIALLKSQEIEFVVDVRSFPFSRFAPHFNREQIEPLLREKGIRYLFLGEELGGRPSSDDHYDEEGHALYYRMAAESAFQAAVERLVCGVSEHRLALMCSEADPSSCHRRLLVGKVIAESGIELRHILRDGGVRCEDRVDVGDPSPSLFGDVGPWRSAQSVSHRRRLSVSSGG